MYLISSDLPGFVSSYSDDVVISGNSYASYVYLIYWIPIVPACNLITNLADPFNNEFS